MLTKLLSAGIAVAVATTIALPAWASRSGSSQGQEGANVSFESRVHMMWAGLVSLVDGQADTKAETEVKLQIGGSM